MVLLRSAFFLLLIMGWKLAPASAQVLHKFDNPGLRVPDLTKMAPDLAPGVGSVVNSVPGFSIPGHTWVVPTGRTLNNPIVPKTSVGFFNDSGTTLKFKVVSGNHELVVSLENREIITVPVPSDNSVKGIIGSGDVDITETVERGQIYVLKASNNKWQFSKL